MVPYRYQTRVLMEVPIRMRGASILRIRMGKSRNGRTTTINYNRGTMAGALGSPRGWMPETTIYLAEYSVSRLDPAAMQTNCERYLPKYKHSGSCRRLDLYGHGGFPTGSLRRWSRRSAHTGRRQCSLRLIVLENNLPSSRIDIKRNDVIVSSYKPRSSFPLCLDPIDNGRVNI